MSDAPAKRKASHQEKLMALAGGARIPGVNYGGFSKTLGFLARLRYYSRKQPNIQVAAKMALDKMKGAKKP